MVREKVYNFTQNFISENKLYEYPINLKKICKDYGWKIKYYNSTKKELFDISKDAFVVIENGKYIIFINNEMIETRQRFSLAHEIGHIVLNHHKETGGKVIAHSNLDTKIEKEADTFARLILCPCQIIKYLPKNQTTISKLFKVSNQMAECTLNYFKNDLLKMQDISDICYEYSIEKFLKIINPQIHFSMWND